MKRLKPIEELAEDVVDEVIVIRKHKDYSGVMHNPGERGYLFKGQDHNVITHEEAPVVFEGQRGFMGTPITCIQIIRAGERVPIKNTEDFLYSQGYK